MSKLVQSIGKPAAERLPNNYNNKGELSYSYLGS
jgi:hypothetical protein